MVPKGLLRLLLPGWKGPGGKKQGRCSNKDFLLAGARWQLAQSVHVRTGWSREMCWIKQALYWCLSSVFPDLTPWFHSSGPTRSTAQTSAQRKGTQGYQNGTWQISWSNVAKPKSGFCLTEFWKTEQREQALWKGAEGPSSSYTCLCLDGSVYSSNFIRDGEVFSAIPQWDR